MVSATGGKYRCYRSNHPLFFLIKPTKYTHMSQNSINELTIKYILHHYGFSDNVIFDLINHYNQPFRAYHTLNHIVEMLFQFQDHKDKFNDVERAVLELAIIFHDVVYSVGSTENEALSAIYFKTAAEQLFNENIVLAIQNLILVTRNHERFMFKSSKEVDVSFLSLYMIMFDLNGFEVSNFMDYEMLVQKEFSSKYTWEQYLPGKLKFLEQYKSKVTSKSIQNIDYLIEYLNNQTGYTFEQELKPQING